MASLGSCDVLEEYAPSGIEFPGPATSSISRNYTAEGYNFGVVVESTLVHGAHDGYAYAAGFTAPRFSTFAASWRRQSKKRFRHAKSCAPTCDASSDGH